MSDAIIGFVGVFVGGLIGAIGTIATLISQHKQWKTHRRIEFLQQKRERYAKDFEAFSINLFRYGREGYFNEDKLDELIGTDIYLRFPQKLSLEIVEEIGEKFLVQKCTPEELRTNIMFKFNSFLSDIDKEIDALTK